MDRKLHLLIAGVAATIALPTAVAGADLKRIRDPRGDSHGTIDIGRAVADHYKGLLRHKIVTYGPFRSSNPQRPCVFIDGPTGKYRICGRTVYNSSKHRRAGQLRDEIAHFFSIYKDLEQKAVTVDGWYPREDAIEEIAEARKRFSESSD